MDPNQMPPQGMPMSPQEMPPMPPQGMPEPMMPEAEVSPAPQPLPEWNPPTNAGSKNDGHKKELLQKLMTNLLGKPGRSVNEIINGVKAAIGVYKNYAKEWDSLNGGTPGGSAPSSSASTAGNSSSIQKIMQGIQSKKAPADGSGGPGVAQRSMMPTQSPIVIPPSPQPAPPPPLIAGQAQQSSFNRPAPVSNLGVWGF